MFTKTGLAKYLRPVRQKENFLRKFLKFLGIKTVHVFKFSINCFFPIQWAYQRGRSSCRSCWWGCWGCLLRRRGYGAATPRQSISDLNEGRKEWEGNFLNISKSTSEFHRETKLTMQHPNDRIQFTQTFFRTCVINQSWHVRNARRKPLNYELELRFASLLTSAPPRSRRNRS